MAKTCTNPECPDIQRTGVAAEYQDSVETCPECGHTLTEDIPFRINSSANTPAEFRNVEKLFHSPKERLVGVLGQGFLASSLQGSLSRCVMVLSDRRVYYQGMAIEWNTFGKMMGIYASGFIDVTDITGVRYQEDSRRGTLILGILLLIMGAVLLGFSRLEDDRMIAMLLGFPALFFSMMLLLVYAVTKHRLLIVQHPGGQLATEARWYSQAEIDQFQRSISTVKDSLFQRKVG